MASSSSSSFSSKCDVFLSFRGEDTRENFISHLFDALSGKKIDTFIDEDINKGERISTDLLNSIIEGSKISIIIFSKNYANSNWCLDELVKILDCKKMYGQIVIPVFYHVHPSDVRKQTASFCDAFVQHEKKFKEMPERVKKWRTALTEVSYLAGHESTKIRPEAKLVDVIVVDVLNKLKAITISTDFNGLVGINWRIKEVKSLLCMGLSDFRIVGIWGMGGIGKTTIAEALFNQISKEFEGTCFMANVREESERLGSLNLQKQILSQLLQENIEIGGPNIPWHTKDRLRRMKVFIVLDDVNKFRQLEQLAGGIDQFGPGSRIIITTRDKQVLQRYGVDHIYKVTTMNNQEALEHFRNFAFRQNHCPQEFTVLSQRVVDYAKGNPLALKVLGSFLRSKSKSYWENSLHNLSRISGPEIYDVLKISYKELDWEVKNIFLDIACFFKGDDEDHVISIFDDHNLMHYGLDVLVEKSLITRSCRKLEMHDLLQEMGQKIVYEESPEEPGKRSRLWHHKDVYNVLRKNKGTNLIKGIFLNLSKIKDIHLDSKVFADMDNLRYLKFYMPSEFDESYISSKLHLPQGLECLHDELKYLHWDGYPLRTLPRNFVPENLIELNLSYGKIEELWEGKKEAPKLRFIHLQHCDYLCSIPDPLEIPNLERMVLSDCEKLSKIPASIQNFNNLVLLHLSGCTRLSYFPPNIHFRSPIKIEISQCMNLTEFPHVLGNVIKLKLCDTAIEEIPSSIGRLTSLEKLSLRYCHRVKSISTNICKLRSLSLLELYFCSNLEGFRSSRNVKNFEFVKGDEFAFNPIPSSVKDLNELEDADLHSCRGFLLPPLSGLSELRELKLSDCDMREIPQDIGCLSSLEMLDLSGNDFESLPTSIKQLSRLGRLYLSDCNMLESLPELPRSLRELDAKNCKRLKSLPELPECLESLDASLLEAHYQSSDVFYNKRIEYKFIGCPKLKENANNILADSQPRVQHMAIALLNEKGPDGFEIFFSGGAVDIPEWFSNRCLGSSITIQLPQHCCNPHLIGFALCSVIGCEEDSINRCRHFVVDCSYRFEIKTELSKAFKIFISTDSDLIMLGFEPCSNVGLPDVDHHTAVSFDFSVDEWVLKSSQRVKVKCCGVCPVYAHPNESQPNTFTVNMVPPTVQEFTWFHGQAETSTGTSENIINRSDNEEVEPTLNRICGEQKSYLLAQIFKRRSVCLFAFLIISTLEIGINLISEGEKEKAGLICEAANSLEK